MKDKGRSEPVVLDLARYELRRSGCRISIERIPMEALILLAQSGGRLLTRKEIADHLWGKNPWLDADRNLNTAIGKIRRVLGDDSDKPRFIETAVGKGYRFVAPVRVTSDEDGFNLRDEFAFLILGPSPQPVLQNANNGLQVLNTDAPSKEKDASLDSTYRLSGRRIVKSSAWVVGALLLFLVGSQGWSFLHRTLWTAHDLDTRVWIGGEWLVGEFRYCQMQTGFGRGSEENRNFVENLPRLYCGEEEADTPKFETDTASVLTSPDSSTAPGGVSPPIDSALGPDSHRFHLMRVHFVGRIERSNQPLALWRCKRSSDSLDCMSIH